MPTRNGIELVFHHMGIPTTEIRADERYSPMFGMYTSESRCGLIRVQWHRFEETSILHPLIRSVPHAAFKVSDLDRAVEGASVLLGPYEPIRGFHVAIIEEGAIPIELIQTSLTDEEIWTKAATDSLLLGSRSQTPGASGI